MILDWLQSNHGAALIGGAIVGLAAALLLVLTGRSMSLSDMLGSLLGGNEGLAATSIAFLAGLVIVAAVTVASAATKTVTRVVSFEPTTIADGDATLARTTPVCNRHL